MSKPWTIEMSVTGHESGRQTVRLEFPYRPSEEELGLKLAAFFSQMNFRFNENLEEIRECALLTPPRSPIESSPN